jgi:hypothetical protein
MATLKLTYPSQNPGTHLLVNTEFEQLSSWLEELPSGNMAKYTIEVQEAVANLNRTELPIAQRVKLMQLLDRAYEMIHNFYRPLMKTGPFKGKHPPEDELTELHRLTLEMSFGYKIAVAEYAAKRTFFRKNNELAYAINMALHYLGLILLESYELYSPIPMHVWSEIYQLYYHAEQKDLSEEQLLIDHVAKPLTCIEFSFLRNCLIALSNPYHLKRGDHWEVFRYLGNWIEKAILSEDPEDFSDKNCFVIDLTHDDKPVSKKTLGPSEIHDKLRFLLTEQLNINICHQIDDAKSSGKKPQRTFSKNVIAKKSIELLEDLLASWEMKQIRKGSRYPIITRMEVVWGLKNIHHVLKITDPLQPVSQEERQAQITEAEQTIIESDWTTLNNSKGGICINQPKEKVRDLDVGLLVALRQSVQDSDTDNPAKWRLGEICWITGSSREGTRVGIQFLNGDIQAVQLQARKGSKLETRFHPAILLSGDTVDGLSTPTLLTIPGLYIEARAMHMQVGEEIQNIHARTRVSSSMTVERFFYQQDFHINEEGELEGDTEHETEEGVEEVIDLKDAPGTYAGQYTEDFQKEYDKIRKDLGPDPSLDDVILKKKR